MIYNDYMKEYLKKHHRLFGAIGGVIAFFIAVIYLKVLPPEALTTGGYQKIILTYGHSVCWFLLSGASIAWAIVKTNKWSETLAYAALVAYAIFISTLLITKFA